MTVLAKQPGQQKGAVLIVALVLLIMITLFAISAIKTSTTELQIVGNMQLRKEMAAAAQEAIESHLNTLVIFNQRINGEIGVVTNAFSAQSGRFSVVRKTPVCISSAQIEGSSLVHTGANASENTYWEIEAGVFDEASGASMQTTQGIRMRMPLNSCPN